jgi:hypothetical protein
LEDVVVTAGRKEGEVGMADMKRAILDLVDRGIETSTRSSTAYLP